MGEKKLGGKSTHIYNKICTNWNFSKQLLEHVLGKKKLKSIDLSATSGTFVTKY